MRRFDAFQSLTISNDFNEINVVTNALAVSENDIFTNTHFCCKMTITRYKNFSSVSIENNSLREARAVFGLKSISSVKAASGRQIKYLLSTMGVSKESISKFLKEIDFT